jgi:hypothetical protein
MQRTGSIRALNALVLTGAMLFAVGPATAKEVYRWIDDEGRVHFSDSRPIDDALTVTTLELAEFTSDYDPAEDPYSIQNQAARTFERWQAIEAARLERAARRLAPVTATDTEPRADSRNLGVPYFTYPPVRPGNPGGDPSQLARQQYRALTELELTGPQPYSINSSEHRARVERSQNLPLVAPARRNR